MTTSDSYFVSKFGWQQGWVDDYDKIILLDRPQKFTNNDYLELSKVFQNHTQRQLFEAMQKMFLPTPDVGEVGRRLNKFKKSIGKFRVDFSRNRRQPNFEEDFLGKPCTYFLKVFGKETQNADTQVEITADTPLSFTNSDQQEVSANRASISLSQSNLVGQNMRLRMKCQDQEEQLARQEVELKSTKRKASSKDANLAKISKKMHAAKEERVASENINIRVTKDHEFDGGRLFQGKSLFMGKPNEVLSFAQFSATKLKSEVTLRHLNNRASFAVLALQMLSGCPFDEVADGKEFDRGLELPLTEIIKKKKGVFKKVAEAAGFQFVQKFTVAQAVDTKSLLRLSTLGFWRLRIIFSNIGLKIFPSEPKMRLYESSSLTHLLQADLAVDKLLLESTGSSMTREIQTVHVLRARDLHSYICSVFTILKKRATYFHEHPEREVNIFDWRR